MGFRFASRPEIILICQLINILQEVGNLLIIVCCEIVDLQSTGKVGLVVRRPNWNFYMATIKEAAKLLPITNVIVDIEKVLLLKAEKLHLHFLQGHFRVHDAVWVYFSRYWIKQLIVLTEERLLSIRNHFK